MTEYVIGVDAGGTKTSACAFDLDGNILSQHITGAGNFSANPDLAWENVISATEACIKDVGDNLKFLAVGAAGIQGAGLTKHTECQLKARFHCPARVVDDGMMALMGKLEGKNGILVIAGTGSVAYGKNGSNILRNGGWGMLLDDRGSGTFIVLEAFRRLVFGYDTGRNLTPMEKALLKEIGCTSVQVLPGVLNKISKGQLAALTPIISKYGEMGHEDAEYILREAGHQLSEMAVNTAKRMELSPPLIAVSGSVLEKCRIVTETFWKDLNGQLPDLKTVLNENRVEKGALWFYQECTTKL